VCKTRQPAKDEVNGNIMAYRNRKGCWAILILAGCDADLKFHMFSAKNSGSTNDVVAWKLSALKSTQDSGLLPSKYFFIGDEAFNNGPQFLCRTPAQESVQRRILSITIFHPCASILREL
jgi:hypothetical protein